MKKIIKTILWIILIIVVLYALFNVWFYFGIATGDEYGCNEYYIKYPWMQYFVDNQIAININDYIFPECKGIFHNYYR